MKSIYLPALIVFLMVIASCGKKQDNTDAEPVAGCDTTYDTTITKTITCNGIDQGCLSDRSVFYLSCLTWMESWKTHVWHSTDSATFSTLNSSQISGVTFENNSVATMKDWLPREANLDLVGLRAYFGLDTVNNPAKLPFVLLVNVDSCADQFDGGESADNVLSSLNGDFINSDEARGYTTAWQRHIDTVSNTHPYFMPIWAYTFKWSTIDSILTISDTTNLDLAFSFHSVGLQDPSFEFEGYERCDGMGSSGIQEGYMVLDLVALPNPFTPDKKDICNIQDFANPCPKFCDFNSPLIDDN